MEKPKFRYKRKSRRPKAAPKADPGLARSRTVSEQNREEDPFQGPWISVRMHNAAYALLRELREYYARPMSKIVMAYVVHDYCRLLAETDPVKAMRIKKAFLDENIISDNVILPGNGKGGTS